MRARPPREQAGNRLPPAGDVKAFPDFMLTKDAQAIVGKNFVTAK